MPEHNSKNKSWNLSRSMWESSQVQKNKVLIGVISLILNNMADEDLIDYNEEEEQTEIVAEKESKK